MYLRMYPGGAVAQLGDTRWSVEWQTIKPHAERKQEADPDYEVDYDRDLDWHSSEHKSHAAAVRAARKVCADSFFGVAQVRKQVAELLTDPNIGEWNDCGDMEEISA